MGSKVWLGRVNLGRWRHFTAKCFSVEYILMYNIRNRHSPSRHDDLKTARSTQHFSGLRLQSNRQFKKFDLFQTNFNFMWYRKLQWTGQVDFHSTNFNFKTTYPWQQIFFYLFRTLHSTVKPLESPHNRECRMPSVVRKSHWVTMHHIIRRMDEAAACSSCF